MEIWRGGGHSVVSPDKSPQGWPQEVEVRKVKMAAMLMSSESCNYLCESLIGQRCHLDFFCPSVDIPAFSPLKKAQVCRVFFGGGVFVNTAIQMNLLKIISVDLSLAVLHHRVPPIFLVLWTGWRVGRWRSVQVAVKRVCMQLHLCDWPCH